MVDMISVIMSEETKKYNNVYTISSLFQPINTINIFTQFFIPENIVRLREIVYCLRKNIENTCVSKIYLLNEEMYNLHRFEIYTDKVVQVNIEKRLKFKHVFDYINENKIEGYNILLNVDIFLDRSIENIRTSDISINKKMFALSRYEYNPIKKTIDLFNRFDSQDTWIIHSNFSLSPSKTSLFDFEL